MKRVIIDAGHGGSDPGAMGNGLREKDATLPVALATEKELLAGWQVEVILTRRTDEFVSIANRASFGRNADLFVSQHFDFNTSPIPRGFWTWRNTYSRAETAGLQRAIHDKTYPALLRLGAPDRGLRTANHDITRLPPCPTVLLEYLFISNAADAAIMRVPMNLAAMGKATAEGIAAALQLPARQPATVQPAPVPHALPTIQRSIGIKVAGEMTGEPAYLIENRTFAQVGYIAHIVKHLTGKEIVVTGHGDHIEVAVKGG